MYNRLEINEHESGGNIGHLKYLLWLTTDREHPVFMHFYYLLPHPIHFETSGGFKTKLILQTLMYKV